jgi:hypothetical protein
VDYSLPQWAEVVESLYALRGAQGISDAGAAAPPDSDVLLVTVASFHWRVLARATEAQKMVRIRAVFFMLSSAI